MGGREKKSGFETDGEKERDGQEREEEKGDHLYLILQIQRTGKKTLDS